jgi:hypothetical protein
MSKMASSEHQHCEALLTSRDQNCLSADCGSASQETVFYGNIGCIAVHKKPDIKILFWSQLYPIFSYIFIILIGFQGAPFPFPRIPY